MHGVGRHKILVVVVGGGGAIDAGGGSHKDGLWGWDRSKIKHVVSQSKYLPMKQNLFSLMNNKFNRFFMHEVTVQLVHGH